jgi:hypothetical protein
LVQNGIFAGILNFQSNVNPGFIYDYFNIAAYYHAARPRDVWHVSQSGYSALESPCTVL